MILFSYNIVSRCGSLLGRKKLTYQSIILSSKGVCRIFDCGNGRFDFASLAKVNSPFIFVVEKLIPINTPLISITLLFHIITPPLRLSVKSQYPSPPPNKNVRNSECSLT